VVFPKGFLLFLENHLTYDNLYNVFIKKNKLR